MYRKVMMATAAVLMTAGMAAADPIEGNWRTQTEATAAIAGCGGNFCITLKSGKRIGTMQSVGKGSYTGKITDPETDKTYSGKASLPGKAPKMSGCVLGGLICRNQSWSRL